jgi:hypothetical protein
MGPVDMAAFNKAVYDALKPGGSSSYWTTPLSAARRPGENDGKRSLRKPLKLRR